MAILDVSGLTLDEVVGAVSKAVDNIVTALDEVSQTAHLSMNSRSTMKDVNSVTSRIHKLAKVRELMVQAKEELRKA